MRWNPRLRGRWLLSAVAAVFALALAQVPAFATGPTITMVLGNLQSPRGIAFDGAGAMYVAEAGKAPPAPAPANGITTGYVGKYSGAPLVRRWHKGFASAYGGEGTIGPSGLSALGGHVALIMSLNHQEIPAPKTNFGELLVLDPTTGAPTFQSDVGDQMMVWTSDHSKLWSEFPDSNPYGVLVVSSHTPGPTQTYVVDAGANTVIKIEDDGSAHVIAYIPNETPVAGLPLRDSTPTCATMGKDGMLYIGTLDLARNFAVPNKGWAHVYRVDPHGTGAFMKAAEVWASGLFTITSCTFDKDGNFWATEMFHMNPAGPPGDVVKIDTGGTQHRMGAGKLALPGGIAQGPDGAMYVTTFSTGGPGAVWKIVP